MEKASVIYNNLTTLQLDKGDERIIWRDDIAYAIFTEFLGIVEEE